MVTHTLNLCSALTHPKCTHTAVNTHTVNTHPEQWATIYAAAPGEQLGFSALLKGTSVVVLRVERTLYIHSPHLQSLLARDSNLQPLDYKSNSLTIRPRLPKCNGIDTSKLITANHSKSLCMIYWNTLLPFILCLKEKLLQIQMQQGQLWK